MQLLRRGVCLLRARWGPPTLPALRPWPHRSCQLSSAECRACGSWRAPPAAPTPPALPPPLLPPPKVPAFPGHLNASLSPTLPALRQSKSMKSHASGPSQRLSVSRCAGTTSPSRQSWGRAYRRKALRARTLLRCSSRTREPSGSRFCRYAGVWGSTQMNSVLCKARLTQPPSPAPYHPLARRAQSRTCWRETTRWMHTWSRRCAAAWLLAPRGEPAAAPPAACACCCRRCCSPWRLDFP